MADAPPEHVMGIAEGVNGKHLLLEVPQFSCDDSGLGLTSYLRLGATSEAPQFKTLEVMEQRTPERGAATSHSGAGEDLACLVHTQRKVPAAGAFSDDERERAISDQHDQLASGGAADALSAQLLTKRQLLDEHLVQFGALQGLLKEVIADPRGWVVRLQDRAEAAQSQVARLTDALRHADEAPPKQSAALPHDDATVRSPSRCPNYLTPAQRRDESSKLHSRGGWRDHTDGNRIVTTRGDKVEVVRGNYRMVVLGRNQQPLNAEKNSVLPGWDVSGGHIEEHSVIVAQQTDIAWTQRHNGTWYAYEVTTKNDTKTVSSGDDESQRFGHYQVTVTGSEDPSGGWHPKETCPGRYCKVNPQVESRVWATSMHSHTGSQALAVPLISDETWARRRSSHTFCDEMTDDTRVEHAMITSVRLSGSFKETTVADRMDSNTVAEDMEDINTAAAITSLTMGNLVDTTTGISTTVNLGTRGDVFVGAQLNLTVGPSAEITIGASMEHFLGAKLDVSMSGSVKLQLGVVNEVSTAAKIDMALLTMSKIAPVVSLRALNVNF